MGRYNIKRGLVGSNRRTPIVVLGAGLLLGAVAALWYPFFGVSYWFWPNTTVDWIYVVVFTGVSTWVAFENAGFLASWWVNFPAHVAMAQYYYTVGGGGIVLLPTPRILAYAGIAGAFTLSYAVLGYLLGTGLRRRYWRPTPGTDAVTERR